jgi:hypothetical protein
MVAVVDGSHPSRSTTSSHVVEAALGAGLGLWLTDVALSFRLSGEVGIAPWWAAAAAALVAGSTTGAFLAALFAVGRRLRRGGVWSTAALPALAVGLAAAPLVRATLVGRGAQQSAVLSAVRSTSWAILPAAAWGALAAATAVARRIGSRPGRRAAVVLVGAAAVAACGAFDAFVHADRYPAAHLLSRLGAALAGAAAAVEALPTERTSCW